MDSKVHNAARSVPASASAQAYPRPLPHAAGHAVEQVGAQPNQGSTGRNGHHSVQRRLSPLIGGYSATKHALEAFAEVLAIEVGRFGVSVHVVQPPAVTSGGAERAQVHLDDSNPYRPLLDRLGPFRAAPVSVQEVADVVTAAIAEGDKVPFRIPVGESAKTILSARKAAPDATPFLAAHLDW